MNPRQTAGQIIPIALLCGGAFAGAALFVDVRNQPINAFRAHSPIEFQGPVPPSAILDAIVEAYDAYVSFEYPNEPGGNPALLPEMEPSADVGDSIGEFFQSIEQESNGLLKGLQIEDTLNIVPASRSVSENRSNLDRIIGVKIENCSAAVALRAVVDAVNQYSVEGYPLKFNPGGIRAGFIPPEEFRTTTVGPIIEKEMTAREVVCRVLEDLPIPATWVYGHSRGAAYLTIRFYEDGKVMRRKPASPDDTAYWMDYAGMER